MPRKTQAAARPSAKSEIAAPDRIRRAAVTLFRMHGYHGTSIRALSDAVDLEPASLYHHFPSKQAILADLFDRTMDELTDGLQLALTSNAGHAWRLRDAVTFHVTYHVEFQDEAYISHSELRSLSPANRARITAKRDRYEHMLREFLAEGVEAGEFEIHDVPMMTIAILMMCSGVSDWFAGRGRLSGVQVADEYARLVLSLTRARIPDGAGGGTRSHGGSGERAGRVPSARARRA